MNKAFRQPSLKKFETVLSAVEVNPKISIKRQEHSYTREDGVVDTREVVVYFRGQRLEIVFDGRNRAYWYQKQIRTGRKYKEVVTKHKPEGKWEYDYGPGVAKTRKNASMTFTL